MSNQAVFLGRPFLHQATVTLTDAQIKALPTTKQTVVTAQGAGLAILIQSAFQNIDVVAGVYGNVTGRFLRLQYTLGTTGASEEIDAEAGLGGVTDSLVLEWYGPPNAGASQSLSDVAGKAVSLGVLSGTGDFTGGNVANTLRVSVAYYVLNTTTGLFV